MWEEQGWQCEVLQKRHICRRKKPHHLKQSIPHDGFVLLFREFWQGAEVERQERRERMGTRAFSSLKFKDLENPSSLMNINKYLTSVTNKTCLPVQIT